MLNLGTELGTATLLANLVDNGVIGEMKAGENVAFGDMCYIKNDGKAWKANAATSGLFPAQFMALGTILANAIGKFLVNGIVTNNTWTWTIGGALYLNTTVGTLSQTAPSVTGQGIQTIGYALSATQILFNPSVNFTVHG